MDVNRKKCQALKREDQMIQSERNVERRPLVDQWDLCFSPLFGLLLLRSSSKGAKMKASNSQSAFLLQDLHPGGAGGRMDGLQRPRRSATAEPPLDELQAAARSIDKLLHLVPRVSKQQRRSDV